jgi:hypothetical protein
MPRGRTQFVGLAGQYYVAYCLTVRGYHATITAGNVPDVDVLVASPDGSRLLSLQVKTSTWAHRTKHYVKNVRQWDVGQSAVGRSNDNLWYAFVDLREQSGSTWNPVAYLVPSGWVSALVQKDFSRKVYFFRHELWPLCEERWDRVQKYFDSDPDTLEWVGTIPKESSQTGWHVEGV